MKKDFEQSNFLKRNTSTLQGFQFYSWSTKVLWIDQVLQEIVFRVLDEVSECDDDDDCVGADRRSRISRKWPKE